MKAFPYLLAIACALANVPAFALIERRIEKRFEVAADVALNVDTYNGAVLITEVPDAKVIEVVMLQMADVESEAEMDARLAQHSFEMTQAGGTVSLVARRLKPVTWSWHGRTPVNLVYEIKVPRRCDVRVATHSGNIVLGSLEGRVVVANESGNIFTGEIKGPVTARSESGQVAITAASGLIDVATLTGDIVVGRAGGRTQLSSAGGYIEVQQAAGELVIRGDGSAAKVGFAASLKHPADIVLSGGELELVLETNSVCTLDLRASSFGKVALRGELPLEITSGGAGRSSLAGTVNGGGPRIAVRASGGSVTVRGVAPFVNGVTQAKAAN